IPQVEAKSRDTWVCNAATQRVMSSDPIRVDSFTMAILRIVFSCWLNVGFLATLRLCLARGGGAIVGRSAELAPAEGTQHPEQFRPARIRPRAGALVTVDGPQELALLRGVLAARKSFLTADIAVRRGSTLAHDAPHGCDSFGGSQGWEAGVDGAA